MPAKAVVYVWEGGEFGYTARGKGGSGCDQGKKKLYPFHILYTQRQSVKCEFKSIHLNNPGLRCEVRYSDLSA